MTNFNTTSQLLKTNINLTGNYQLVYDGKNLEIQVLEPFRATANLLPIKTSDDKIFSEDIQRFFAQMGSQIRHMYAIPRPQYQQMESDFDRQYFTTEWSGVRNQKYFAPLWITRNQIPEKFVIYRIPKSMDSTSNYDNDLMNKEFFQSEIINQLEIVKIFDLSSRTSLGKYLRKHVNNQNFKNYSLQISGDKKPGIVLHGISILDGTFKSFEDQGNLLHEFKVLRDFNEDIEMRFRSRGIISANLLNLSFEFETSIEDEEAYRYVGFYVNEEESEIELQPNPYQYYSFDSLTRIQKNFNDNKLFLLESPEYYKLDDTYLSNNRIHRVRDYEIRYGFLYDWPIFSDRHPFGFVNQDGGNWRVPSVEEWEELIDYVEDALPGTDASITLRSRRRVNSPLGEPWDTTETPRWSEWSLQGTDDFNFSILPGGKTGTQGHFEFFEGQDSEYAYFFTNEILANNTATRILFQGGNTNVTFNDTNDTGYSIRLVRDLNPLEENLPDGSYVNPYIGNDGKKYKAVKIGNQVWTAENLAETRMKNDKDVYLGPYYDQNGIEKLTFSRSAASNNWEINGGVPLLWDESYAFVSTDAIDLQAPVSPSSYLNFLRFSDNSYSSFISNSANLEFLDFTNFMDETGVAKQRHVNLKSLQESKLFSYINVKFLSNKRLYSPSGEFNLSMEDKYIAIPDNNSTTVFSKQAKIKKVLDRHTAVIDAPNSPKTYKKDKVYQIPIAKSISYGWFNPIPMKTFSDTLLTRKGQNFELYDLITLPYLNEVWDSDKKLFAFNNYDVNRERDLIKNPENRPIFQKDYGLQGTHINWESINGSDIRNNKIDLGSFIFATNYGNSPATINLFENTFYDLEMYVHEPSFSHYWTYLNTCQSSFQEDLVLVVKSLNTIEPGEKVTIESNERDFWWTLYEPLAVWEEDDYLVGFDYFQYFNDTKGFGYDWIGPGWNTSGSMIGEPDWNDPNAFPYDDGDSAYFHMYLFVAGMTEIPDQPGKYAPNAASVWNGDDNIAAWMIEDQDGEKYIFTNSTFGAQYVDLWADTEDSYDGVIDGAGYLMFHFNPFGDSPSTDNPKLPEQEYRDNFAEMGRFGEKASKGEITSLKLYYRLEDDPETFKLKEELVCIQNLPNNENSYLILSEGDKETIKNNINNEINIQDVFLNGNFKLLDDVRLEDYSGFNRFHSLFHPPSLEISTIDDWEGFLNLDENLFAKIFETTKIEDWDGVSYLPEEKRIFSIIDEGSRITPGSTWFKGYKVNLFDRDTNFSSPTDDLRNLPRTINSFKFNGYKFAVTLCQDSSVDEYEIRVVANHKHKFVIVLVCVENEVSSLQEFKDEYRRFGFSWFKRKMGEYEERKSQLNRDKAKVQFISVYENGTTKYDDFYLNVTEAPFTRIENRIQIQNHEPEKWPTVFKEYFDDVGAKTVEVDRKTEIIKLPGTYFIPEKYNVLHFQEKEENRPLYFEPTHPDFGIIKNLQIQKIGIKNHLLLDNTFPTSADGLRGWYVGREFDFKDLSHEERKKLEIRNFPIIGEVYYDFTDFYIFSPSWSAGFYRRYDRISNGERIQYPTQKRIFGYLNTQEIPVFMASKNISLSPEIEIPIRDLELIQSMNEYDSYIVEGDLLIDEIFTEFFADRWTEIFEIVNENHVTPTFGSLQEWKKEYVRKNILSQYEVEMVSIYELDDQVFVNEHRIFVPISITDQEYPINNIGGLKSLVEEQDIEIEKVPSIRITKRSRNEFHLQISLNDIVQTSSISSDRIFNQRHIPKFAFLGTLKFRKRQ